MSNNRKLEQALKKNRETNEKLEAAKQSAERAMRQAEQANQSKRIFLRIWAMIFERLWMQLWELIIPIVYYEGAKKWTADFYLKI